MRNAMRGFGSWVVVMHLAPAAQAQVFFRQDMSAAAAPAAGWGGPVPENASHRRTHIPGGGPRGEDAYELRQLVTGDSAPYFGGEFYWGWNDFLEAQDPSQGARRFYRFRMRFSDDTNFRGINLDGEDVTLINKVLMIGDGCGRYRCRVILNYRGADNGMEAQYLRVQIDGGEDPAQIGPVPVGQWLDIQLEVDSSTTTTSADGGYKLWVNNDDYSHPSAERMGIQLNPVRWRYVFHGAYNNNGLLPDGVHTWRTTGFEAAMSFDANWHSRSGGGAPSPAAPTNLRVVPAP